MAGRDQIGDRQAHSAWTLRPCEGSTGSVAPGRLRVPLGACAFVSLVANLAGGVP